MLLIDFNIGGYMWYIIAGEATLILSVYVKAMPLTVFIVLNIPVVISALFCLATITSDRKNYAMDRLSLDKEWQPIATAPKDGRLVIVGKPAAHQNDHVVLYPIEARFIYGVWKHDFADHICSEFQPQPTLWKPLKLTTYNE